VIINIINNAVDILSEQDIDEKWIKIELEDTKDYVTITIEDNGGGILEDILPKIFDPYFTTKHQAQGTGIGLYMSYDIIHNHIHGNLYAKNTENGAKFFIEIPK
jgi:C4-dicarboxylate-specific signal transduction histidine kinase